MLLSFDVFGTLINVRESSYDAFRSILGECGRPDVDVRAFWEYWEERNISHYWEPYRPYKEICALSLGEAFAHFNIAGDPSAISRYFDAFSRFQLYPDVLSTLETLGKQHRLAIVSNIDNDLLAVTPYAHRHQQRNRCRLAVEPHPDHRAIQDEADNILVSQRTTTPCLPIRLHLSPGPADNIFANRTLEQCPQRPPHPTRIGAGQIGAGDQRLHLPRHSPISWQRFTAPLSRPEGSRRSWPGPSRC